MFHIFIYLKCFIYCIVNYLYPQIMKTFGIFCFQSAWRLCHHAIKACLCNLNWDTNAHIKFIFDMAIDDPGWKNPTYFG